MKTLYININNEEVQSNEELEVLKHDLDGDFFFYLGEKIAKSCKIENENALITDFNTQDTAEGYQKIIAQWDEIKTILFSEECEGEFKFTLPDGYIHWLRYSEKYNHVYDTNFSHGESAVISIDLEELYEESVEDMQRKILRTLKRNDLYLEVDEIIFNDDVVTRKSQIVRAIKEKYEGVGFKTYKKLGGNNSNNSCSEVQFVKQERNTLNKVNKDNLTPILDQGSYDEHAIDSLVQWICTGYYLQSKINLRDDDNALSRIKYESEKVIKELKTKTKTDFNLPYIGFPYQHIVQEITRQKLLQIVSKSSYNNLDFPKSGIASYNNSPLTIICPKCASIAEYNGDYYECKNCNLEFFVLEYQECPHCHNYECVVEDFNNTNVYYCTKCRNKWNEL